jgi:hypothetical protein
MGVRPAPHHRPITRTPAPIRRRLHARQFPVPRSPRARGVALEGVTPSGQKGRGEVQITSSTGVFSMPKASATPG